MTELSLRGWQASFIKQLEQTRHDEFLLVACPAAGKTLAAVVAAAQLMKKLECDQLVVACPTVVVRDQWIRELERLAFRMVADFGEDGWPEHVHGVAGTYAQIARRAERYGEQIACRRTVVVLDEVHHAGADRMWGDALKTAFGGAVFRLLLSGTPFRSDEDEIPFVRYDAVGRCVADFGYDYGQAVKEGVCRPIRFQPHNGTITWRDGEDERTATFAEPADWLARARRLRASLDPTKPYLRSLLAAAHRDLLKLREKVPGAGALVVADSRAHARAIDKLLDQITGSLPVVALSDMPRSHEAIRQFADSEEEWLVSVRMVSEGVDIPRLGVIVWATAAKTEMMVRQVSGRALRGRAEYSKLPAIVHMPADPTLIRYAERLEVLGGISARTGVERVDRTRSQAGVDKRWKGNRRRLTIDPAPFVEWYDRMARGLGGAEVCRRCGWSHDAGARKVSRWRNEGGWADPLELFDACHMAGMSFHHMFAGDEYEQARAYVDDPDGSGDDSAAIGRDFRSVDAQPMNRLPDPIMPRLVVPARRLHSEQLVDVAVPMLPPSPQEVRDAEYAKRARRNELVRLVNTYMTLRGMMDERPEAVHDELRAAVGQIGPDASPEKLEMALVWARDRLATFAQVHPMAFKDLAARHRRLALRGEQTSVQAIA